MEFPVVYSDTYAIFNRRQFVQFERTNFPSESIFLFKFKGHEISNNAQSRKRMASARATQTRVLWTRRVAQYIKQRRQQRILFLKTIKMIKHRVEEK